MKRTIGYFFRAHLSQRSDGGQVDQTTGVIPAGRDPYQGSTHPRPSGSRLWHPALVGSGDVYDGRSLQFLDSLPHRLVDAAWLVDGSLLTVRATTDGRTQLEQWSADLLLYNVQIFQGSPIRVVVSGENIVVITARGGQPAFDLYVPTDDGDGDGVVNSEDAFPTDPAAAVDTDRDGYPNAWNAGMSAEDSSLGLALDAFPDDFACQVLEHGVEGVCDFRYILPANYAEPFCQVDEPLAVGSSGGVTLAATRDFVPLCDGWMLIGDTTNDRILIHNVIQDRQGAIYPLGSAPGDLELDEDAKLLYIALPDQRDLGVLDLITGELTVLPVGIDIIGLSLGSAGDLFMLGRSSSYDGQLYWLAADAVVTQGPCRSRAD